MAKKTPKRPADQEPEIHATRDLLGYHRSITDELHSLKDRIRDLIHHAHWQTDGEHKEVAFRSILRRHVPESFAIGRGFIVGQQGTSRQLDVLVIDRGSATLFKDGDLMIVTPDCVKALVEIKTQVGTFDDVLGKIAANGKLAQHPWRGPPAWTGLLAYEDAPTVFDQNVLLALQSAYRTNNFSIDCVALGKDRFFRYWPPATVPSPEQRRNQTCGLWRSYRLPGLSASYFLGNMVQRLAGNSNGVSDFAWFPLVEGKEQYATFELAQNEQKPRQLR